jgi:small subunit ribosomal protein S1
VSELSWRHVEHPSEVVQVGQEVEGEVLDVDLERERISLSLKKTQEDPWRQFARLHQPGEIIEGQVTKLVPFGAFVRVADGVEGLVHISELADRHVDTAEQVVTVNEDVKVKIIEVDSERRRISLSIKQAATEGPPVIEEIELESEEEQPEETAEVAGPDVLEAAMAPEVETAKPEAEGEPESEEEDATQSKPLGEETIEAIVADLKRRQSSE